MVLSRPSPFRALPSTSSDRCSSSAITSPTMHEVRPSSSLRHKQVFSSAKPSSAQLSLIAGNVLPARVLEAAPVFFGRGFDSLCDSVALVELNLKAEATVQGDVSLFI